MNVDPGAFLFGVAAEVVGAGLYLGVIAPTSVEEREEEAPTVALDREPSDRDYQLLVPIANPENVDQLMRTALDIAADRDGEVLVMSVVTLPEQTPLSEGRAEVVLGSTVDTVVTEADCDVLVERVGPQATGVTDSILVPTAGGPHATLAAEVARAISNTTGATIDVVHVVAPDADEAEREAAREKLANTSEVLAGSDGVDERLLEGTDVVERIVAESGDYDLTVIGATREGLLQQFVFGTVPEAVGRGADSTVIMTKKRLDITSTLRRLVGVGD